jgi:ParB-like chromosome segregation protein Spo0J
MRLVQIPPSKLELSLGRLRLIAEAAVQQKVESLRSKGQLSPLVAAEHEGVLVLVDGFVRHMAAVRLGLGSVAVQVVELSPPLMKAQVYLRNRERGLELLEECRLVRELSEVDGLSQVAIGELCERHKSWVCRRLALVRALSPHLLDDGSLGGLGIGSLQRLGQLPARNQEELLCAATRDGLSATDAGKLVELFVRTTDPVARDYLLDHPADAVARARGRHEAPVDPRLSETARALVHALSGLCSLSLQVWRRLEDGLGALPPEGIDVVADAQRQAAVHCERALGAVARWVQGAVG